jgi:hypothetical protein
MGCLYLGQDNGIFDMGSLYLGQDMGVSVWAGCIYVRIGV